MKPLDRTFHALSDPTRRAILARLALGEATVGELARPFAVSLPAISQHLNVLEEAHLVVRERMGQQRRCRLDARGFGAVEEWLAFYRRFWSGAFDRLDAYLKKPPRKPAKRRTK